MSKYIDADLIKSTQSLYSDIDSCIDELLKARSENKQENEGKALFRMEGLMVVTLQQLDCILDSLQQEQLDEQPEYGYLSTKYIHGKKSRWNVGDVLAYYICTSNEEGECLLGKIVNVQFDEDWWVYTFEDESTWDEQSLVEEGAYKKN